MTDEQGPPRVTEQSIAAATVTLKDIEAATITSEKIAANTIIIDRVAADSAPWLDAAQWDRCVVLDVESNDVTPSADEHPDRARG